MAEQLVTEGKQADLILGNNVYAHMPDSNVFTAGLKTDLLRFICDAAPSKPGRYMPGSHIPILPPDAIAEKRPDHVMILPWNIADEVTEKNVYIRDWGGLFVKAVPAFEIIDEKK